MTNTKQFSLPFCSELPTQQSGKRNLSIIELGSFVLHVPFDFMSGYLKTSRETSVSHGILTL